MTQIIHHIPELREYLKNSEDIVLVPTMGNLHAGHLSLVEIAKQYGKTVVVSVFVNPLQFGPTEDYAEYPRTLEEDCTKLKSIGVDVVFAPGLDDMYPDQQTCFVVPDEAVLEASSRPGFFLGVATVVLKLFNIVQPKTAIFGKKDYQQLRVIQTMTRQLNLPIQIIGAPIARAEDGLALSSRNSYLSEAERAEAPRLHAVLEEIQSLVLQGDLNYSQLIENGLNTLRAHGWKPDYIAICPQDNLSLMPSSNVPLVVLGAATLGTTRLIDNIEITPAN